MPHLIALSTIKPLSLTTTTGTAALTKAHFGCLYEIKVSFHISPTSSGNYVYIMDKTSLFKIILSALTFTSSTITRIIP
jgi:hypothetical protein